MKTTISRTEYMRLWRERNRLKMRRYKRKYNKLWRQKNGYQANIDYNNRWPLKLKARRILTAAIVSGKVKKAPCEVCGKKKAQGHHDDYSKPLEVRWLCALHHTQFHRQKLSPP